MLWDLSVIFVFMVFGFVFVLLNIMISRVLTWLFNINKPDLRKLTSYECGENPVGDARVRFNSRFYLVALVFLIFDVEAVFLVPIAVIYGQNTALALAGASVFLGLLILGLIYDWVNEDLDWVKPKPRFTRSDVQP